MPEDFDDERDPLVAEIRSLNYRYIKLFFHPVKEVFVVFTGWKDSNWSDVTSIKTGIDSDEKLVREIIFGPNVIDIEQKSISRLLVDEV
jgi:cation-transporting ATPase 13A2